MLSIGPVNPSSAANRTEIGTLQWTNPQNAKSNDGIYAEAIAAGTNVVTNLLYTSLYNMGVPANASISGIEFTVERFPTGFANNVVDAHVYIVQNGVIQSGVNKKLASQWGGVDGTTVTYGSGNDLWGLSWNADSINASGFGLAFSANIIGGPATHAVVDLITAKVYYDEGTNVSNSNISLYINGYSALNDNLNLYTAGSQITNSGLTLYLPAYDIFNNNTTLYEQGINQQSDNLPLTILGNSVITNNFPLFEQGYVAINNNLELFIYGRDSITNENPPNQLPLFIQGSILDTLFNTFPLFIGGISNINNVSPVFTLFEQGHILVASSVPLFIHGYSPFTVDTPPPNPLTLFIKGPSNISGYIPLYITGPAIVRMCEFTRYINRVTQVNLEI